MPISLYEAIWIFLIYAFLGWVCEVAFAAFRSHSFVNRGFLNGPLCPVYGFGVLAVIVILYPLRHNFFLLFFGSFVLVSAIEFFTGFLLEKLFHNKWWDYSERKFNIRGYICPLFSLLWGLGCTLVLKVFHPIVYRGIRLLPQLPGAIALIILCLVSAVDLAITVANILRFNERLQLLDEIAGKIKVISDEIGENIYEGVAVAVEKGGELKENIYEGVTVAVEKGEELRESFDIKAAEIKNALLEKKAERLKLQQQYNRLLSENVSFGMKRIMRAFPRMKSNAYQEALLKWKHYWGDKRRKL
jgi:uncharacterized membrane protein